MTNPFCPYHRARAQIQVPVGCGGSTSLWWRADGSSFLKADNEQATQQLNPYIEKTLKALGKFDAERAYAIKRGATQYARGQGIPEKDCLVTADIADPRVFRNSYAEPLLKKKDSGQDPLPGRVSLTTLTQLKTNKGWTLSDIPKKHWLVVIQERLGADALQTAAVEPATEPVEPVESVEPVEPVTKPVADEVTLVHCVIHFYYCLTSMVPVLFARFIRAN